MCWKKESLPNTRLTSTLSGNIPNFDDKLMVPFPGSPLEKTLQRKISSGSHYVVMPWQDTDNKINYRRFFPGEQSHLHKYPG